MTNWTCDGWPCRILLGLVVALLLAILLGWVASSHPWIEAMTNIRAQLIPVALVPVIGFIVLRRWNLVLVAAAVLVVLLSFMLPYWTATADPLAPGTETITVMQYNVFFGNDDFDTIVAHIAESNADVVALHELLPSQWVALEPLLDGYPYRIAAPLAETEGQPGGGMALISKTPLDRIEVSEQMSPPERVTLVASTIVAGQEFVVVGLHPHASRTEAAKVALREAQVDGVAALANETDLPVVVLADLNATPTSSLYQGFLDDAGWRDPHRIVGWHSTWPTWGGPFGIPIDHVLVSNEFALHSYQTGGGGGSDHKSLVAVVSVDAD